MSLMETIKQLRQMTGCGIVDCKKALTETNAVLEDAVVWLRKKGIAKAAKKADRDSNEGAVGVATDGTWGALLKVSSETDFVARNETFHTFVNALLDLIKAQKIETLEALQEAKMSSGRLVKDELTQMVAVIGESLKLTALETCSVSKGLVASYLHNVYAPGIAKIGVLVGLTSDAPADELAELGDQLAMHVAANNPAALKRTDLDAAVLEKEKRVFLDEAKASGKPAAALDKIVEGRLKKFCSEVVFEEQPFIMDPKKSVQDVLAERKAAPVVLSTFAMLKVG